MLPHRAVTCCFNLLMFDVHATAVSMPKSRKQSSCQQLRGVLTALPVPAVCEGSPEGLADSCSHWCQPDLLHHLPLHVSGCLLTTPCVILAQPALHCSEPV